MTDAIRCSCGQHDLPGEGPFEDCHFCGHPTSARPLVDWTLGRMWFAICHRCAVTRDYGASWYVAVSLAPEAMLARAIDFGEPPAGEMRA